MSHSGVNQGQAFSERDRLLGSRVLRPGARLQCPPGAHRAPVRRVQVGPRAEGAAVRVAGAETPRGLVLLKAGQHKCEV